MTYLLIITLPSSPIPCQIPHTIFDIILLGVDAVYVMTSTHVRQFTLEYVAKYYKTISWKMVLFFHAGFKETLCASTGDNRHNCAPTQMIVNRQQAFLNAKEQTTYLSYLNETVVPCTQTICQLEVTAVVNNTSNERTLVHSTRSSLVVQVY